MVTSLILRVIYLLDRSGTKSETMQYKWTRFLATVAKVKINFSILTWRDSPLSQATIKCDLTVHTEFNLRIQ